MFSELMARAKMHFDNGLPFVLYRRPKEHLINGMFQKDAALHSINDFKEEGFVFAPFHSRKPCVLILRDELIQAADFSAKDVIHQKVVLAENDFQQKKFHTELIKKAKTEIHQNEFEKVVISRHLTVDTKKSPFNLFVSLLSNYADAFCYLWFHPKVGLWLGATPEILLQTQGQKFTTMSLAGTRVYTDEEDKPWGNKELTEQALVTRYIERTLKGKVSNLDTSEVEAVRAGNLQHLRTKIVGEFQGNLMEIVNALHPTPAVCGLPLEPAREFILEHEQYDREFYTGFLGELNLNSMRQRIGSGKNQENQVNKTSTRTVLWVNLRCMKLVGQKAIIYVGGGITNDSIPENEWQETREKSKTMLYILLP